MPIGQGQTISQPYIVALMTHLAAVKSDDTVLEVGTGSGYQAAILARLVRKVCTVQIIPSLAEAAAKVLSELGHDNVSVRVGDGYHGLPECGSFDAVIVTAGLSHVPPPRVDAGPFRMLATLLDRDPFLGRILTGRIDSGKLTTNMPIKALDVNGNLVEEGN